MSSSTINILGLGSMGEQISALLLLLGYNLNIFTSKENHEAQVRIDKNIKLLKRTGIKNTENIGVLDIINNIGDLSPNLTLECLPENLDIKKSIILNLPYGISLNSYNLLTNTSSFLPREIHSDAIGLHFFNPITKLKFFEFCSTDHYSDSIENLLSRLRDSDFLQINVRPNRGYIANFFLFREIGSLMELYELYGYKPEDIDLALSCLGNNLSFEKCLQLLEIIGVDVANHIFYNLAQSYSIYHPKILIDAQSLGILGKKNRTSLKDLLIR